MQARGFSERKATRTVQLYCEMIPLPLLQREPFLGTSPLLGQMRNHLRERLTRGSDSRHENVRLELVLRVTLHPHDEVLGKHGATIRELLADPERWGVDSVRLWPQLTDDEGVYLNGSSLGLYFERLRRLLDYLADAGLSLPPLLYDLEPSKDVLDAFLVEHRGVLAAGRDALSRAIGTEARVRHARMARSLLAEIERVRERYRASTERSATNTNAVSAGEGDTPMHVASVFPALRGRWRLILEQALATPTVEPLSGRPIFDGLEGMAYGSLARYILPEQLHRLAPALGTEYVRLIAGQHNRWCSECGITAGILFGCTGVGLLGNEPTLASPGELARHVVASGGNTWSRVGLYNLRGLIADGELPIGSRDWRPWLEALTVSSEAVSAQ